MKYLNTCNINNCIYYNYFIYLHYSSQDQDDQDFIALGPTQQYNKRQYLSQMAI